MSLVSCGTAIALKGRGRTMAGARAICSGTVSFGLVSIPVKAYKTASDDKVQFNMITKKGNRVKMQFVDAITKEVIDRNQTDNGFEYEKDKFVVFTDAELDSLAGEKNTHIEILEVASDVNLSPSHVEDALYLSPNDSDKAYRLLATALRTSKRVAVCKWYTRGKDHLVAIAPVGDVLMMFKLYYEKELRPIHVSFDAKSEPSEKEITLANRLLDQLSTKSFKLGKYEDEYLSRVRTAVELKKAGKALPAAPEEKKDAGAFDLEALLAGSLKDEKAS